MGLQEIRKDWQRLAMIGDAVINLCLRNIYFEHGEKPKGIHEKTYFKASNKMLGKWAKMRGVYHRGGNNCLGALHSHADFFEAMIGALYVQYGIEAVMPEMEVYAEYIFRQ